MSDSTSTYISPEEIPDPINADAINEAIQGGVKKALDGAFGRIYDDVAAYLYEHLDNYKAEAVRAAMDIMAGRLNGRDSGKTWVSAASLAAEAIRRKVFEEHRDELVAAVGADLVKENEKLKEQVAYWMAVIDRR